MVAVGYSILTVFYSLLTRKEMCQDLGVSYFDKLYREGAKRRTIRRL